MPVGKPTIDDLLRIKDAQVRVANVRG